MATKRSMGVFQDGQTASGTGGAVRVSGASHLGLAGAASRERAGAFVDPFGDERGLGRGRAGLRQEACVVGSRRLLV